MTVFIAKLVNSMNFNLRTEICMLNIVNLNIMPYNIKAVGCFDRVKGRQHLVQNKLVLVG